MDTSSRDTAQAVSLLDAALPPKPLYLTARRQGICTECWMHSPFLVRVCMQAFFPGCLHRTFLARCYPPCCLFDWQAVLTVCVFHSLCVYLVPALQAGPNGCWDCLWQSLDAACIV